MDRRGFTLMEVALAIALMAVLTMVAAPFFQSYQLRSDLDMTAEITVQTLRRAQALARAMEGDTSWGVKIQAEGITLFQGASYAGRDANYDEVFTASTVITPSGVQEIVFEKFTGLPQTTGTLVLTNRIDAERSVTINSQGMISY